MLTCGKPELLTRHLLLPLASGAESTLKVGVYFNIFPIFLPISESGGCNKKPTN